MIVNWIVGRKRRQKPISEFLLASFSKRGQVQNHSYTGMDLACERNSFSYEWFCIWPRFEKEANSNSEVGY